MTDLRRYKKKRNKRTVDENDKSSFVMEITSYRKQKRFRIAIIIIVILAIVLGFNIYTNTKKYTDYKAVTSLDIDDGEGNQYIPFGKFFITYGLDGISYINGKELIWNQAYEMSNPIVDVCENYAVVADKGTNTIYIFDQEGVKGQVSTSYPIISIGVANQGVVAALLEEKTANYIEVYNKDGNQLISHKTLLGGNGYPLAFSLSDDGKKMIVSYICVSSGTMQSKVLFYNFSDVGQNTVDRMVGGFNHYKSTVIPTVKFLNNSTAVAIGDNIFSIYKMKERPSLEKEIEYDQEIKKLFYNEKYIGMVFDNSNGSSKYRIKVYNLKGKQVMNQPIDTNFDTIKFSGKNVLIYDDMSCKIISFNGRTRFEHRFKESINGIMATDKFRDYLLVTNNTVKKIRIK